MIKHTNKGFPGNMQLARGDPNRVREDGATPVYLAAPSDPSVMKLLLENSGDVNFASEDKTTVAHKEPLGSH